MFIIYALCFESGRIYVGMTSDLDRRVKKHGCDKTRSTKDRGKFTTKVIEICSDRIQARQRKKFWKSGRGRESLKHSGIEQSGSSSGS